MEHTEKVFKIVLNSLMLGLLLGILLLPATSMGLVKVRPSSSQILPATSQRVENYESEESTESVHPSQEQHPSVYVPGFYR